MKGPLAMKSLSKFLPGIALSMLVGGAAALAQDSQSLSQKKGPMGKIFLSETQGEGQIISDGKIYEPKQASAFNASGTVIETRDRAHQAYVYSNGTGMYLDANTRVEIQQFTQEPFLSDRNLENAEPSRSQSDVYLAHGMVGICTNQFVSGSRMVYTTSLATVNVRGQRLVIKSTSTETVVYVVEGDATVKIGNKDLGSQVLKTGERATIRSGPGGPSAIVVEPIDRETMSMLDDKVTIACSSKRTVSFETTGKGANGADSDEIVAHPTVVAPAAAPNLTVSADRLGTNG
jgi:FecR protein